MNQPTIKDPTSIAVQFAKAQCTNGFNFDFSYRSLFKEIDKLLNNYQLWNQDNPASWQLECELEAYIGETLCRLYDGIWHGTFRQDNPGPNFYLSYISFGEYILYPSHFIGYRICNGEKSMGSFAEYLQKILPEIESRMDQSQ